MRFKGFCAALLAPLTLTLSPERERKKKRERVRDIERGGDVGGCNDARKASVYNHSISSKKFLWLAQEKFCLSSVLNKNF